MESPELISDALSRINRLLHRALDDVSVDIFSKQPSPETNSMCWLVWHLCRVQDHHVSDLLDIKQLWVADGWHDRFGMAADASETGTGHTVAQVAALRVSPVIALAYADAVWLRSQEYLASIVPGDLDAIINEPQYDPLPTVGIRLVSVISDNTQHAGQIMYLRGLFEGAGWQTR